MSDTLSELVERLATTLRTLNLASLDNVAIGPGQWRVLLAILDNPGIRSSRLAAVLGVEIDDRVKHDEDRLSRCFSEQESLQFRQFLLRAQGAMREHILALPTTPVDTGRYQRKDRTCASFS